MRCSILLLLLVSCVLVSSLLRNGKDCEGRRIYITTLPPYFNYGLDNAPATIKNGIRDLLEEDFSEPVIFNRDMYDLDHIAFMRLLRYDCLVRDPTSQAVDIIYLPVSFSQFGSSNSERGCLRRILPELLRSAGFPKEAMYRFGAVLAPPRSERIEKVVNYLESLPTSPLWNNHTRPLKVLLFGGILGRHTLLQSHFEDMTSPTLDILQRSVFFLHEGYKNPKKHLTFTGMPYPGHVQFSSNKSLQLWTHSMLKRNRPLKIVLAAGNHSDVMALPEGQGYEVFDREKWLDQCIGDESCTYAPIDVRQSLRKAGLMALDLYSKAEFCLQPPGDAQPRQGIFDSLMAGCIPVLYFTAVKTYTPMFIPNPREVMIVLDKPISDRPLGPILNAISKERKARMKENIMKLIPRLVVSSKPPIDFEDAFDIAIKEVVKSPSFTIADLTDDLESWPWRTDAPPPSDQSSATAITHTPRSYSRKQSKKRNLKEAWLV